MCWFRPVCGGEGILYMKEFISTSTICFKVKAVAACIANVGANTMSS